MSATPPLEVQRTGRPSSRRSNIRDLSVAALRTRFLDSEEACSAQMLGRLRQDPRKSVQNLAKQIASQRERVRNETRRMDALLSFEQEHWDKGLRLIAGVDEVGMGPLAGPVVSAAAIFSPDVRIERVNDSKQLTAAVREELSMEIRERAVAFSIGVATVEEIAEINIRQAGLLSMKRALEGLRPEPELVVVDAHTISGLKWPQEARIKADAHIHCVAAASVVAKVYRDQLMCACAKQYPEYGFEHHKGYGTAEHIRALKKHGPTPIHRQTFHWGGRQLDLFGKKASLTQPEEQTHD